MKIGFAIITEDSFVSQIVALEHEFHEKACFYDTLGVKNNIPHTTIFQGEMKNNINYLEIADFIANEYNKIIRSKHIHFTDVEYVSHGWYFLMCEKTKELSALHNLVLDKVSPFIILPKDRLNRITENMPEVQRNAIRDYNYRYAGDAFCPHITIGRSSKQNNIVLSKLNEAIKRLDLSPHVDKITVYKMGANGTHENTLYEVKIP